LALAGLSKAQIMDGIKKAFQNMELPALEQGAMTYMMSKQGRLNDRAGHWVPHLMFYVPVTDKMTWGADMPGSPVLLNPHFNGAPEPVTEFMVPVSEWSDGTPASTDHH
jgi:long-subunit fatty acid transport protein